MAKRRRKSKSKGSTWKVCKNKSGKIVAKRGKSPKKCSTKVKSVKAKTSRGAKAKAKLGKRRKK